MAEAPRPLQWEGEGMAAAATARAAAAPACKCRRALTQSTLSHNVQCHASKALALYSRTVMGRGRHTLPTMMGGRTHLRASAWRQALKHMECCECAPGDGGGPLLRAQRFAPLAAPQAQSQAALRTCAARLSVHMRQLHSFLVLLWRRDSKAMQRNSRHAQQLQRSGPCALTHAQKRGAMRLRLRFRVEVEVAASITVLRTCCRRTAPSRPWCRPCPPGAGQSAEGL
jgi:hypothetical protein